MFSRILDVLFGCTHSRYSFPITVRKGLRSGAAFPTGTYVVCLNCGHEMPYDWKQMKIVGKVSEMAPVTSLAAKEAAYLNRA